MKPPQLQLQSILCTSFVAAGATLASVDVSATTLPILRDLTVNPESAWWTTGEATRGGVDDLVHASNDARWLTPMDASPDSTPSRLLRRLDITPANAVALADLYGADTVLHGTLFEVSRDELSWLGLVRCELGIDAQLLSVESATAQATLQFSTSAYRATASDACDAARVLLVNLVEEFLPWPDSRPVGVVDTGLTLRVSSPEGARPFLALRELVRGAHPDVTDIVERWATEGTVVLEVTLGEGANIGYVAEALESAIGRSSTFEVRALSRDDSTLAVTIGQFSAE